MAESKEIVLGSGSLYIAEYSDSIPDDTSLEIAGNLIAEIKGGASVEYKPTIIEVESDELQTIARFVGKEEITFKSGIMKWNFDNLAQLAEGTLTDDTENDIRTLKLGAKGANEMTKYVVRFVHTKQDGYKIRATLVGSAVNGFTIAFVPDKETVIDAEFKAMPHDTDGTQLIYSVEYASA